LPGPGEFSVLAPPLVETRTKNIRKKISVPNCRSSACEVIGCLSSTTVNEGLCVLYHEMCDYLKMHQNVFGKAKVSWVSSGYNEMV